MSARGHEVLREEFVFESSVTVSCDATVYGRFLWAGPLSYQCPSPKKVRRNQKWAPVVSACLADPRSLDRDPAQLTCPLVSMVVHAACPLRRPGVRALLDVLLLNYNMINSMLQMLASEASFSSTTTAAPMKPRR